VQVLVEILSGLGAGPLVQAAGMAVLLSCTAGIQSGDDYRTVPAITCRRTTGLGKMHGKNEKINDFVAPYWYQYHCIVKPLPTSGLLVSW
jgi:hypothetical protein